MSEATGPVLVLNAGSSSLKYQLVVPETAEVLASGLIERIGEPAGRVTHTVADQSHVVEVAVADHGAALTSCGSSSARTVPIWTRSASPPSATGSCTAAPTSPTR